MGTKQAELYRVILNGIGENSLQEKNEFCKNFSDHYNIPIEAVEKIINKFPVVIKKNLTREKAEILAKNLKAFGARVTIQKKVETPEIYIEFQNSNNPLLALESASIRISQSGLPSLVGRVKNVFKKELNDIWVLIQIFDEYDDVINFEEVPIPINPLPANVSSPFKIVFEKDLQFKKISIAFKNSSGSIIPSLDVRRKKKWLEIELEEIDEKSNSKEIEEIKLLTDEDSKIKSNIEGNNIEEVISVEKSDNKDSVEKDLIDEEKASFNSKSDFERDKNYNHFIEDEGEQERLSLDLEESYRPDILEKKYIFDFPWIEDFKRSIEEYYNKPYDIFINWFNKSREQKELENDFHSVLTILINARFNQIEEPEIALENTKKVFRLVLQPDLSLDKIPKIEGTRFFSPDEWRELFYRAIPKIKEVAKEIINKKQWDVLTLDKLIQIIPHMGERNSRLAIRWLKNLAVDGLEIDCSNGNILIGRNIYRVASRLGILNPNFDHYNDKDSMAVIKLQSFAKEVYPQDPIIIEEPMNWVGSEDLGFCFPKEPNCSSCLFGEFCYKLYISFDPSEKGILQF